MINLLPSDNKKSFLFAKLNQALLKIIIVLIIGIILMVGIGVYGNLQLNAALNSNQNQIKAANIILNKDQLTATENKIASLSNDFRLLVKVLSSEVIFSTLLTKLANSLPNGASLTGLQISNPVAGSAINLTLQVPNYQLATQVQLNLANPNNGLFSHADIENITCGTSASSASAGSISPNAPTSSNQGSSLCTMNITAQFSNNSQYLFINQNQLKNP